MTHLIESRSLRLQCLRLPACPQVFLPHEVLVLTLLYLLDATDTRRQGLDTINLICKRIQTDYYIRQEAYKFLSPNLEDKFAFLKVISGATISRHVIFLNLARIPMDEKLEELVHVRDGLHSALEVHLCLRKYSKPFTNLFTHAFVPSCQNLALDFGDIEDIADERFHLCLRQLVNLKRLSLSASVHDTDDNEWTHFWDINGLILNKCMPCTLGSEQPYHCEQESSPSPLTLLVIKATFGWEFPCDLKAWIDGYFDYRFVPVFESERLRGLLENRELDDEWAIGDLDCFLLEEGIETYSLEAAVEFWEQGLSISKNRELLNA